MTKHDSSAGTFELGGDLKVNRLGFGAMRLTGPGILGEPEDREEARRVLRRALELGVNFVDTADAYGPETNENLIHETLHPYPESVVIATKGGHVRDGRGAWLPAGGPDRLKSACEASLGRLGVDSIDLYQFHRPDPDVPFEESVGALAELQSEGKVRHVGLSNVSVEQLRAAREIVTIVSVQNRYNVADRASEDVLEECEQAGIAFIPWNPLVTESDGVIGEISRQRNASPGQVSLAWLLQHSPVILPIPGTSSVAHLEENVAAASISLTEEEVRALDAA